MPSTPDRTLPARRAAYWRVTRRLTALLLTAWFVVSFGVIFLARELSGITLFGWPVSFYMAAQGTILIYVLIVGFYAWRMQRLDRKFIRDGGDAE
ncbi:MAG: hypothetical protein JWQ23_1647 [Herminiimonas sp.]|jgi:putative solute:sodium symporter small subunit|nr:hypothetical protein [Herminiimonas sp.]